MAVGRANLTRQEDVVVQQRIASSLVLGARYLCLTRYSWLLGFALIALTPVALKILPGMLANLFVLDLPQQIYHISWIAFWCTEAVMETLRVTTLNAPERFDDYRMAVERFRQAWGLGPADPRGEWYRRWEGWLCLILGLATALAIWFVIMNACISCTAADPSPSWEAYAGTAGGGAAVTWVGWREAIKGLLTTMAILGGINGAVILWREWLRRGGAARSVAAAGRASAGGSGSPRLFRAAHFLLGPGYFQVLPAGEGDGAGRLRLGTGHLGLLAYTTVFLAWYALNYRAGVSGSQPMPTEMSPYPALFYGLMSLLLVTYVLCGLAFYFDRYRIPVALVVGFATLMLYGTFGTDHFYELNPRPARKDVASVPSLTEVYDQWKLPRGKKGRRTLVVVHASGGGIQASAWTAQVLTGLHEQYGDDFSRSIGLISAVSGGSVGSMYYLAHRGEVRQGLGRRGAGGSALSEEAIRAIRDLSRASALEATAWGVAYPDTMRAVFPPAVHSTLDRGWAIERVWRQRLTVASGPSADLGDLRLSDLALLCREHQLPVVVFNATLVETGQRILLSPALSPPAVEPDAEAAVEMMRVFPGAHLRVSTAARLSATFPYVTPAARAATRFPAAVGEAAERLATYHVVDGGYSDNEGAVTSVDWINRLLVYYSRSDKILQRPFDDVLLIRIQAFPKTKGSAGQAAASAFVGWRSALLGPLNAMMKVRVASQTERGDLEVDLLTQTTRAQIAASKERFESELRLAQGRADFFQQAANAQEESLRKLVEQGKLTEADIIRPLQETRDRLNVAQAMLEEVAKKLERISQLTVASVLFDFQPAREIGIPLSWKLTAQQKQNIDEAWERVTSAEPRHPALALLDEYFFPRP